MADFSLRNIPDDLALGIKAFAHTQGVNLNQAMIELLRRALDGSRVDSSQRSEYRDPQDIATLGGTWNGDEMQAFRAAIAAMEKIK